jgi:UPF0176 protein
MAIYSIAALYQFVSLPDYEQLKEPLLSKMLNSEIKGTVLLAAEGINGTVAGKPEAIEAFLEWLSSDAIWHDRLTALEIKFSTADEVPFPRCKVKLKKEIVTMGIPNADPAATVGTYVDPQEWNALISEPDVLLIDTRNDYEVKLGQFNGATNPKTETFREFPEYAKRTLDPAKHKKIAMYCTGGIRCEKSTSFLKSMGFEEVYHLKGGILKYLEKVPEEESLWEGECFVFDERVAINHQLQPGNYEQCHACRLPLAPDDLKHPYYVAGESCPNCYSDKTPEQRARYRERQKQIDLAQQRGEKHTGEQAATIRQRRRAEKKAAKENQRTQNQGRA